MAGVGACRMGAVPPAPQMPYIPRDRMSVRGRMPHASFQGEVKISVHGIWLTTFRRQGDRLRAGRRRIAS